MATKQKSKSTSARPPRRAGRRTTLRVPVALESELSLTARRLGATENEALVYLAQMGAAAAKRRRAIEKVTARRQRALVDSPATAGEGLPSPEEAREAVLAERR
jgi:hypothetical protein